MQLSNLGYYINFSRQKLSRKLRLKAQVLPSARMRHLSMKAVFSLELNDFWNRLSAERAERVTALRKLLPALFPDARKIDGKT